MYVNSRKPSRPSILSDRDVIVNYGHNFTLFCEGDEPLEWTLPKGFLPYNYSAIKIFEASPKNKSRTYGSEIFVYRVMSEYVGYFKCSYKTDENQMDWAYLYVRNENRLRADDSTSIIVRPQVEVQYSSFIIPCKPTWPNVTVRLFLFYDSDTEIREVSVDKINEDGTVYTLDPHYGFKTNDTVIARTIYYYCTFEMGENWEDLYIEYEIEPVHGLKTANTSVIHVGEEIILVCWIRSDTFLNVTWTTPKGIDDYNISNGTIYKRMFSQELKIRSASFNHSGTYSCSVTHDQRNYVSDYKLRIYGVDENFIKLIPLHGNKMVKADVFDVSWKVGVQGYPPPEVFIYNNKNELIYDGEQRQPLKYDATKLVSDATWVLFTVYDVDANDNGNFTLIAKTKFENKTLSLCLCVIVEPRVELEVSNFYLVGRTIDFKCLVKTSLPSKIVLFFKPCLDTSCDFKKVQGKSNGENFNIIVEASFESNRSGQIQCSVENAFRKLLEVSNYIVTDVENGFDIVVHDNSKISFDNNQTNHISAIEGYDLVIECKVSILYELPWGQLSNNDSNVNWFSEDKIGLHTEEIYSEYSKSVKLIIRNISSTDSGTYICFAHSDNDNERFEEKAITLKVAAPSYPAINRDNMEKDVEVNYRQTAAFYCEISGFPEPKIRWFKNNESIQLSKGVMFSNNNQTLVLPSTSLEDEGIYRCEAFNILGKEIKEVNLKVTDNTRTPMNNISLVAIIVCVLIVLLAIAMTTYFIYKNRKLQRMLRYDNFKMGAPKRINPKLTICDQAIYLPYDVKWEFSRDKLTLGEQLGSGAFGVVVKAVAKGIKAGQDVTTVAVKMVKENSDYNQLKVLVSELKIMQHLGKHINVVNLLGACTMNLMNRELLVIVEYCPFGNLQNCLQLNRNRFIDLVNPETGNLDYTINRDLLNYYCPVVLANNESVSCNGADTEQHVEVCKINDDKDVTCTDDVDAISIVPGSDAVVASKSNTCSKDRPRDEDDLKRNIKYVLCTKDLLEWAYQVARGMEYLVSRNVLHGDLAARNILLTNDNVVKISDFGLARRMLKNNYRKRSNVPLPIKWMAVETIKNQTFSMQSDVWSFGILLWEFFSLGKTPYPDMKIGKRFYKKLFRGYRMESPKYAPREIYRMMLDCWQENPRMRPSFEVLSDGISSVLADAVRNNYMKMNDLYTMIKDQPLEEVYYEFLPMMSPPELEDSDLSPSEVSVHE